jgi:hypothetical protein
MKKNKLFYALGGTIEAETGEVVQTPSGKVTELEGNTHEQGGIDIDVPDGTNIFSDRLGIIDYKGEFKTLAERKKDRLDKLTKISKGFKYGYADPFTRNSAKRVLQNAAAEEESDLRFQDGINKELGTGQYGGKIKAALGMSGGVSGGSMSAGTVIGLASQLFGSIQAANDTKNYIKNRPQMSNFYRNYGINALTKLKNLKSDLEIGKQHQFNLLGSKLAQREQTEASQIATSGGTLNLQRALRGESKRSTDQAFATGYSTLEGDYSNKLVDIGKRESEVSEDRDRMVGYGNAEAFKSKMEGYDNYFTARSKNTADRTAAFANVGTQLNNQDYRSQFLSLLNEGDNLTYGSSSSGLSSFGSGNYELSVPSLLDPNYNSRL